MTRTNAQGGEYQSAMPHAGQFKARRFITFDRVVLAYIYGITTGVIAHGFWSSM